MANHLRCGIFVDNQNIRGCGGYQTDMAALRQHVEQQGQVVVAQVFVAYDARSQSEGVDSLMRHTRYRRYLQQVGFDLVERQPKRRTRRGVEWLERDCDTLMAGRLVYHSLIARLEKVFLVSGDGDFVDVVRLLQHSGREVEVIAMRSISAELLRTAGSFCDGRTIPGFVLAADPPRASAS